MQGVAESGGENFRWAGDSEEGGRMWSPEELRPASGLETGGM